MKCKKILILLCMILFVSIGMDHESAHASKNTNSTVTSKVINSVKYVEVEGSLIMRDTANSKGKKVTMLKDDSKVFVYSTDTNGWSYVKQGNFKGYVKDSYLTTSAPNSKTTNSNSTSKSNTTTSNKIQGYGTIKGTVTWQYNKYIGTKPDVGARVFLIPTNFDYKSNKKSLDTFVVGIADGKSGLLVGKVNGYGGYEISDVPIGKYVAIIVSKETTRNFEEDLSSYTVNTIKNLLGAEAYANFERFNLELYKHTLSEIEIKKDKTLDFSHDFGYTYF